MKHGLLKAYARKKDIKRRAAAEKGTVYGEKIVSEICGEKITTLFYRGDSTLIVTVHGGGFLYNSVYDEDAYCAYLNKTSGHSVASLDYTRSYKRAYPTQLNQCAEQIEMLSEKVCPEKLVLIGHSAGANLAAALTLKNIGENNRIPDMLVLDYPALDNYKKGSKRKFYPFTFTARTLDTFAEIYCEGRENRKDPLVSPLYADDASLSLFPPTLIVKCRGDRLACDAELFEKRLLGAGVKTLSVYAKMLSVYAKMRHGFIEDGMKKIYAARIGAMTRYAKTVTDAVTDSIKETLGKEKA